MFNLIKTILLLPFLAILAGQEPKPDLEEDEFGDIFDEHGNTYTYDENDKLVKI